MSRVMTVTLARRNRSTWPALVRTGAALAAVVSVGACSLARLRGPVGERDLLSREVLDSVSRVLRAAVKDKAFPGAYVVVGDSRGVIAEYGAGRLDWRRSPRPTSDALWDLASLTKVIGTTTALAQLIERGHVSLDAPVQRYVPDWTGAMQDSVTVRHLLTHTSGLPSFRPYDTLTHNRDTLAMLLFRTPLERRPGLRMVYSDIGAFMMGVVVERVSGRRLDQYLAENVFGPLGMAATMFSPPDSLRSRIAPTEIDTLRGGLVRGFVHDERAYYLGGVAAHAGLFSSARDVSRFATMLVRGGAIDSVRVLQEATIALFTSFADSAMNNRALGWQKASRAGMRDTSSSTWAGHYMSSRAFGHTGFTGTSLAVDPWLDVYIILLSNRVNPTRANTKIYPLRSKLADAVIPVIRRSREHANVENQ
jgi:CubicO group peptidase (beta-lactamase class C family)